MLLKAPLGNGTVDALTGVQEFPAGVLAPAIDYNAAQAVELPAASVTLTSGDLAPDTVGSARIQAPAVPVWRFLANVAFLDTVHVVASYFNP
jgi:hypothetical protein